MMATVDRDLKPVNISTRVGTAVETVGQAGRPKTITGFQTHTSPVLLGAVERAEFANEEYLKITSVLEGVVIVEKAPRRLTTSSDDYTGVVTGGPNKCKYLVHCKYQKIRKGRKCLTFFWLIVVHVQTKY